MLKQWQPQVETKYIFQGFIIYRLYSKIVYKRLAASKFIFNNFDAAGIFADLLILFVLIWLSS